MRKKLAEKYEVSPETIKRVIYKILGNPEYAQDLLAELKKKEGRIDVEKVTKEQLRKMELIERYKRSLAGGKRKRAVKEEGQESRIKVSVEAIRRLGKKPESWTIHDLSKLRAYEICRIFFAKSGEECTWDAVLKYWNNPKLYKYIISLRDFVKNGLGKRNWLDAVDEELGVVPLIPPPKPAPAVFTTTPQEIKKMWDMSEKLVERVEASKTGIVYVAAPTFRKQVYKIKPLDCKVTLKAEELIPIPDKTKKIKVDRRTAFETRIVTHVKPVTGIRTGKRGNKKELWGTRVQDIMGGEKESWIYVENGRIVRWHVWAKWDETWEIVIMPERSRQAVEEYIRKFDVMNDWLMHVKKETITSIIRAFWQAVGNQYAIRGGSKFKPLHAFRKAYVQLYAYAGVDLLDAIKVNVGWKDPKVAVGWYLWISPELSAKKYERVAKLFGDNVTMLAGIEEQQKKLEEKAQEWMKAGD